MESKTTAKSSSIERPVDPKKAFIGGFMIGVACPTFIGSGITLMHFAMLSQYKLDLIDQQIREIFHAIPKDIFSMDDFNFVYGGTSIKSFDEFEQYFKVHDYTCFGRLDGMFSLEEYTKGYIENIPAIYRTEEMNQLLKTIEDKTKSVGGEGSLFDQREAAHSACAMEIVPGMTLLILGIVMISLAIYIARKSRGSDENLKNEKGPSSSVNCSDNPPAYENPPSYSSSPGNFRDGN
jgi:hypothetical protein